MNFANHEKKKKSLGSKDSLEHALFPPKFQQ